MTTADDVIVVFTEYRPDRKVPVNPIPVAVPGLAGKCAEILIALGYRFDARLTDNVVVLSISGSLHPGLRSRDGVVASVAAPNDGESYRVIAPVVIHDAYAQLFPGPFASA
jgi:hypothetical protein